MTNSVSTLNTPHQKIWHSTAGETVKNNKILTGITATGAGAVIAGAAAQSEVFSKIADKGIAPALGATVAGLGAAAMHDAMTNDWSAHKGRAGSKLAAGTVAALGGTEIVGRAYDIPVAEEALTGTVQKILENGETLLGTGLLAGGLKASQTALKSASTALENKEHRALNAAKAAGAAAGGALATLAGTQMIGQQQNIPLADKALTKTLEIMANSNAVVGGTGAALTGGALISADQAINNLKRGGNEFASAALASGALAGTLGGAELMGRAANIDQAKDLFIDNAQWLQGLSLGATGLAWVSNAGKRIANDALTGSRGLEVSAGAGTALTGLAYATENLSERLSDNLGTAAELGASGGLGLATIGFGKQMQTALENHKPEAALFNGTLAALSAVGSLFALGDATNSPLIDKIGNALQANTIDPLVKHVITPAMDYLYDNPIAGGLMLMGGAAAMLHLRGRHNEASLYD